jgi:hypothetical protein
MHGWSPETALGSAYLNVSCDGFFWESLSYYVATVRWQVSVLILVFHCMKCLKWKHNRVVKCCLSVYVLSRRLRNELRWYVEYSRHVWTKISRIQFSITPVRLAYSLHCMEFESNFCWHHRHHNIIPITKLEKTKTPWSESASELYRPSDRRLSAKWLPLRIEGATWSAWRIPTAVFSVL